MLKLIAIGIQILVVAAILALPEALAKRVRLSMTCEKVADNSYGHLNWLVDSTENKTATLYKCDGGMELRQ